MNQTGCSSSQSEFPSLSRSTVYTLGYLAVGFGVWLVPFFHTGATNRTWKIFPSAFAYQHNASALFTDRTSGRNDYHVEWLGSDGTWFELDEDLLFPMVCFGNRTRLDRLLSKSLGSKISDGVQFRLADHLARQARQEGFIPVDVVGLRFVVSNWPTGLPDLIGPEGAWKRVKAGQLDLSRRRVLKEYKITDHGVQPLQRELTKPPRLAQPTGLRPAPMASPTTNLKAPSLQMPPPVRRLVAPVPVPSASIGSSLPKPTK